MKLPDNIAAWVAAPVLVACCVAPAFMAGMALTSLGWFAGFSALELAVIAFGSLMLVFAFLRLRKVAKSNRPNLNERLNNE